MTSAAPMDPLPVRTRLTVLRDGSTRTSEIVFCAPLERSVPLSRCASCRHGGAVRRDVRGRGDTVECCRFALPSSPRASEPPPSGERLQGEGVTQVAAVLPVGLTLTHPVVCVVYDAPLAVAARALDAEAGTYGIAVVDEDDRIVGMLPRARAALGLLRSAHGVAAEHMTAEWCSIDEGRTLGEAFATLTARHARELTILGEKRGVVGTLRDIDALRFVSYVSRTGLRPPVERAA